MKALEIDWCDLDDAMDLAPLDHSYYLDKETGAILWLSNTVRQAVEDGEDASLLDWQQQDVELARRIDADVEGARYVLVEPRQHGDKWQLRYRFASGITDEFLRHDLLEALERPAALKAFIEVLADDRAALALWKSWQRRAHREAAVDWLHRHGIEPTFKES